MRDLKKDNTVSTFSHQDTQPGPSIEAPKTVSIKDEVVKGQENER